MMKPLLFLFCCALMYSSYAQDNKSTSKKDADIKKKMQDEIRKYYLVMLTNGENRSQDSASAAKIQEGHLANINRLYYEGKIKVAGPFARNPKWAGLFIFDVATEDEVKALLNTDPAISSGRLAYEIYAWYTAPVGSFAPGKPGTD